MFKKILLPVDFEEADMTRQAIEAAVEIAGPDAELRPVNVQAMLPATFVEYGPPDYEGQVRLVAEKQIVETAAKINYPRERVFDYREDRRHL